MRGLFEDPFGGPLGLDKMFFADTAETPGRSAVINNQPTKDDAQYQDLVDILLGRKGGYEDPIQFILDNSPGLLEKFKDRIDVDPRLGRAAIYNRLFPGVERPTVRTSDRAEYVLDPETNLLRKVDFDATGTQATLITEGDSQSTEGAPPPTSAPPAGSEAGAPTSAEPLRDVHRFSGAEAGKIQTLEGTLKEERTNFINLTDVDFSEILEGYAAYGAAIQAIYDAKMGFIQASGTVDGQAKTTAMTLALQEYHALTHTANRDLERVMAASNLRLVTEFSATTGILPQNQILKGAPHREPSGKIHKAPKSEAVKPRKPPSRRSPIHPRAVQ